MRGRGLKTDRRNVASAVARGSPPVRGRGLKLLRLSAAFQTMVLRSPPVRGRGLKPGMAASSAPPCETAGRHDCVAPRAGAWIETDRMVKCVRSAVAPRAGAWIETSMAFLRPRVSPPVRGRGLKPANGPSVIFRPSSPPCGGRGLKLSSFVDITGDRASPPVRGRGLKLGKRPRPLSVASSPPVAWIETTTGGRSARPRSPPVRGRGLKHCAARKRSRHGRGVD